MAMLEDIDQIKKPADNPPLFNDDKTAINDLIVDIQYVKKAFQIQINRHLELKNRATILIDLIQKEYHLQ